MALRRIMLRDFVIVQQLDLELHTGFSVLTGETGAGKSILIDALQLLLGARADVGLIREGAALTEIAAEFDVDSANLCNWLEQAGVPLEERLLLRRTIDEQGRSRAWINGSPVTVGQMRTLGGWLVDIHGQHAWQNLTRTDGVRGLLDAYAGASTQEVAVCWAAWRQARQALEQARTRQDSLLTERERLQWQIEELEKLAPQDDEWDELNARHARLSNAQALLESAQVALSMLEDEDSGGGTVQALAQSQMELERLAQIDPAFADMAQVLASCHAQATDVVHSLHNYLRHTEPDPQALAQLDERLGLWLSLARRYKRTAPELPALLASWRQALQEVELAADLAGLQAQEQAKAQAYQLAAQQLSAVRGQAADGLGQAITQAMQGLGMAGGRFVVQLEAATEPGSHGADQVRFLVSSHPGMTPRPIGKVASGGELSRVALAISVTTSALGEAPTLIFDEVDSGVGGAVAETVGRLMQQLGQLRQVLAVTHLPQVAACANHHLVVAKQRRRNGTLSTVQAVVGTQREQEVGRMLGGEQLSATTLAHAQEMLALGRKHRRNDDKP